MKIFLIDQPTGPLLGEGPARYVESLARALKQDHQVTVIHGVPGRARLRDLVIAERPDVMHVHQVFGLALRRVLSAADAGRYDRVPVALTMHDYGMLCTAHALLHSEGQVCGPRLQCQLTAALHHAISGPIGLVVSPSQYLLDRHLEQGLFKRAAQLVLPYGVTAEASEPSRVGLGVKNILHLGTMHSSDGPQLLIRAFRHLSDPSLRLHLTGDGPALRNCQGLANGDSRIAFHGTLTEDAWRGLLARTDCTVLPSLWPASPPARLFESLQSGGLVIASRVGGIPEVLKHEVNGLLIEAGDEPAAAAAIERLRLSPELAARLRGEGRKTALLNDIAFHAAHLAGAYRRLIATSRISPLNQKAA